MQTQLIMVRKHLNRHGSITPLQALKLYGIFRLASRICELRKVMEINKQMVKSNGKWYAEYRRVR